VGCAETLCYLYFEDPSGSFGLPSITANFLTLSILVPQNVSGRLLGAIQIWRWCSYMLLSFVSIYHTPVLRCFGGNCERLENTVKLLVAEYGYEHSSSKLLSAYEV
jgi:hypothetical protein